MSSIVKTYYVLEPEVAGGLGERSVMNINVHPPLVSRLHYQFEGWLGDEIVASFPCYLVTAALAERLTQAQMTGVVFSEVEISVSDEFLERSAGSELPRFQWLKAIGVAGRDDFGIASNFRLVVSAKALEIMVATSPRDLGIESFPRDS